MKNKNKETQFNFEQFALQAAEDLKSGKPMVGRDGVFTPLLKRLIEASLEGELDAHLAQTRTTENNRRDRTATFEPQIVEKRQHKITSDIDGQIIALYGRGLSYSDIQSHLKELYGIDVSEGVLSAITDRIIPEIKEWQNRPLESVYPVIWLDAMHFKVRDNGTVQTKAIYNILGVTREGEKEVLGIYFGEHESSTFWRAVLHELQQRGVKDIFVACIDNLKGFGDAIEDLFPHTDVQLCLVHQMRNSMKYITEKDIKPMVADLKKIYTALNADMAKHYLEAAENTWGDKYKIIFKSWRHNWERLINFFKYPPALRRVIYTTNPIESYHRMIRKVTKTKGAFNSENAIIKQIYLATLNAQTKWNGTIFGWSSVRCDLNDYFGNRFFNPDTLN